MQHFSNRFLCACLLLTALLISSTPAEAKYSRAEIRKEEKKLGRAYNRNNTGAGAVKVQVKMVRYLSKQANRADIPSCKRKYKRRLKQTLKKIRELNRKRRQYSFRGRWAMTVNSRTDTFHFSKHNKSTDFVSGDMTHQNGQDLGDFSGYQKFNRVRCSHGFGGIIKWNIASEGGPTARPGTFLVSGKIVNTTNGAVDRMTGTRISSPFDN